MELSSFLFPSSSTRINEKNSWTQLFSYCTGRAWELTTLFFPSCVILFLTSLILSVSLLYQCLSNTYMSNEFFFPPALGAKTCLSFPLKWPSTSDFKSKMAFFTFLKSAWFICLQVLSALPSIHPGWKIGHLWVMLLDFQ